MFDVRITEIATGRVTNYFDVDQAWIDTMDNALDSGLFEIVQWRTPSEDGMADDTEAVNVYADNATSDLELDLPYDDLGSYHEDCLACTDSERYDDHMHEGSMSVQEEAKWEAHNGGERY